MQPFPCLRLDFIAEHGNEPPLQPGHIAVHIAEQTEREFPCRLFLLVHAIQDFPDLFGNGRFRNA